MQYKATTINGEPKLEEYAQNGYTTCDGKGKFIDPTGIVLDYIGPAIPDGTILDESEVEIKHQFKRGSGEWLDYDVNMPINIYQPVRRVATLKAKEPEEKIPEVEFLKWYINKEYWHSAGGFFAKNGYRKSSIVCNGVEDLYNIFLLETKTIGDNENRN